MKNWQKTTLITLIAIIALVFLIFYVFDLRFSVTSNSVVFEPAEPQQTKTPAYAGQKPRNIIVFIADGMGFAHMSLAMLTKGEESSVWQRFEAKGWHDSRSYVGPLTDSGASGTALSTGVSTHFEVIGLDHEGSIVSTLFEVATDSQYVTGIVTDSYIWDATPAAFVAHTASRDSARIILNQLADSELDVLFGELEDLGEDGVPEREETMQILTRRFEMLDENLELPPRDSILKPIAAVFEEDEVQDLTSKPNLVQLTTAALEYISRQDKPFTLLIESEEMDASSHDNDSKRVLRGLESIQRTLTYVLDFAEKNGETLVLFTADHETGGLSIVSDREIYPDMQLVWSSRNHTATVVPLMATGPGAGYFTEVHRNRDIGKKLKSLITSR